MQTPEFEKALLVAACWQLARSGDVNELLAIACTIRNAVVPRPGKVAAFRTYGEAINHFLTVYSTRALPTGHEPALVDFNEGLLVHVDKVYDNTMPDITSSRNFSEGASSFDNALPGCELIGMFGGRKLYGRNTTADNRRTEESQPHGRPAPDVYLNAC